MSECIITPHGKCRQGYGQFVIHGRSFKIHRLVYELCYGAIPDGLLVRHSCDNPSCVNPLHLSIGTVQDNSDDCTSRLRHAYGMRHGCSKLTDDDIVEIRRRRSNKEILRTIARDYGVSISTISLVCNRKYWSHIP